jgi:Ca-activated chloride channel family protein
MVTAPRNVAAGTDPKEAAADQSPTKRSGLRSAHDISLSVELDAGVAIENVASSSHVIELDRPSPSRAVVRIAGTDTIPNKDFTLTYQVAGAAPKLGVLAHRDGGTGTFMLIAQPPEAPPPEKVTPREIVFVLDTSSSMRGAPLAKAKELIRRVLWTMRSDDTFQIVRFADRSSSLGSGMVANKPANVQLTLDWLAKLEAGGGTEVIDGVAAALAIPHDPLRVRLVVFVSDGYVGNEDEILAMVGKHAGDTRLFSFGIGSVVNRYLLEEMATIGRGSVQVVRPDEDTANAVSLFERRIDSPLLTDIQLEWGGGLAVTDVVPHAIPDLFAGQPLVLSGHYATEGHGILTVRAKQAGKTVRFEVPVSLPKDTTRPAVAALWARQRIGELSRALLRAPNKAADDEILALSLAHHILSPSTAFVAVDDSKVTKGADARKVVVPVEIPEAARSVNVQGGGYYGGFTSSGWGGGYGSSGYGSYSAGYSSSYERSSPVQVVMPQVVIGSPEAHGDLDKGIIRRYIKRSSQKITYCYEKALLRKPELAGTVTTEILIDANNGHVAGVSAKGLGDKEVEACIAGVIRDIEFPSAKGGSTVKVIYPFKLVPAATIKGSSL